MKYLGLSALIPSLHSQLDLTKNTLGERGHITKPVRLREGGTIGLVSPGFIIPDRQKYDEIQQTLQQLGFNVKVGNHALARRGYFAGSDQQRAADLNAMFADPEVDAIIPFRGGWGSNRILEHIDFDVISDHPKPLIGFSDITSLLLAIFARTGLVTFHGPVGKSTWNDFTYRHFQRAVMQSRPFTLETPGSQNIRTIQTGKATGPLLGGNLTVLTSMMGSDYLPDFTGAILFIEDVGEDVYRIDRMLTQLKLNGILDQISGLLFGKCTNCEPGNSYSLSLDQVLDDHFRPLGIPACYGAMIGHIDEMFTLPVGLPARMDAATGMVQIDEPAVTEA